MENNSLIKLIDKKRLEITGVKKLDGFDEKDFYFDTVLGYMHVKGKKMSLTTIDTKTGNLIIEGDICCISYTNKASENFWNKMFK